MDGKDNLIPVNTLAKDLQREIRSKGGKARAEKVRQRKTIAEALRQVLDEQIDKATGQTRLDAIAIKTIKNLYDNPSVKGMKMLAEIFGELEHKINAEGLALNIMTSEQGKANIEKIMGGDADD